MNQGTCQSAGRDGALLVGMAALLSAATLASMWQGTGGHFMLPLDDSYIHLQYARMLASGHPYVYSPGGLPSGGATSPGWVLVLAPAFLAGAKGVLGAVWSYALCTAILALSALTLRSLVARLASPAAGFLAGAMFLCNGHLLWNFLSGMETGLFTLVILLAVRGLSGWQEKGSAHWRRIGLGALAFLPLVRPEGFIVLAASWLWLVHQPRGSARHWVFRGALLAVPGLLHLAALSALTGEWKPAGMIAKGLMDRVDIGLGTKLWMMTDTLVAMPLRFYRNVVPDDGFALFKGTDYMPYAPLGLPLVAFAAGIAAWVEELRRRDLGTASLAFGIWMAGLGALCAAGIPFIHQQRYAAPWTALVIVLACVGIHRLRTAARLPERSLHVILLAFLVLSLPSVPYWVLEYGRNARDIYRQHREMSFTVAPGESIAVTDTGVLVYYPQSRALDLVGLTTAGFTRPWIAGESAVLEQLGKLDPADRPRTLITFREWFSPLFPIGEAEYGRFLTEPTISAQRYLARYPIEWRRIEAGCRPPVGPGDGVALELNVADLQSERAAGYRPRFDVDDERPKTWPRPLFPLGVTPEGGVCGGRFVRSEEFEFSPPPGFDKRRAVLVARVARTAPDASPVGLARSLQVEAVSLDSGLGATAELHLSPGVTPYIAPVERLAIGDLLDRAGGTRWRFRIRAADPPGAGYLSFHYLVVERPGDAEP